MIARSIVYFALVALTGCVEVPTFHLGQCNGKRTPDALVGTSASKPVKLGETKIEDAIIVLAEHVSGQWESAWSWAAFPGVSHERPIDVWSMSPDGRHAEFRYELHTWTALLYSFRLIKIGDQRVLRLDVDEDGVVTASQVLPISVLNPKPRATVRATDYAAMERIFEPMSRIKLEGAGLLYATDQRPKTDDMLQAEPSPATTPAIANP